MSDRAKKIADLARLAADERTPQHEREAAALTLAKIINEHGHKAPTSGYSFTSATVTVERNLDWRERALQAEQAYSLRTKQFEEKKRHAEMREAEAKKAVEDLARWRRAHPSVGLDDELRVRITNDGRASFQWWRDGRELGPPKQIGSFNLEREGPPERDGSSERMFGYFRR